MLFTGVAVNAPILYLWAIFYTYWIAAAAYDLASGRSKKVVKRQSFAPERANALLLLAAWLLTVTTFGQKYYPLGARFAPNIPAVIGAGLAVGLAGILFAIWARMHLGGNWSGSVVMKKGQTLVRTGPYAIVRNPIYTGIAIGIMGSAIAEGTVTGLLAVACIVVFSYFRITAEEKLLKERFGKDFEEYKRDVKVFVPLVL